MAKILITKVKISKDKNDREYALVSYVDLDSGRAGQSFAEKVDLVREVEPVDITELEQFAHDVIFDGSGRIVSLDL